MRKTSYLIQKGGYIRLFCFLMFGIVGGAKLIGQRYLEDYETCPTNSYLNYFDKDCGNFIKTPDEILLGQARVLQDNYNGFPTARCTSLDGIDLYIPENRPGWAIALAHTSAIMNNFMGGNYLSINHLFATSFQESWFNKGVNGAEWPARADHSVKSFTDAQCGFAIKLSDGYFHTDVNGRGFVQEMNQSRFTTVGETNFVNTFEENAHLAMLWNNTAFRVLQYARESQFTSFLDNAADPYAATKIIAGAFNQGQNLPDWEKILVDIRPTTINATDLLPHIDNYFAQMYAHQVSGYTQALDAGGDSFFRNVRGTHHEWYDRQMTWQDVEDYLDKICPIYIEKDCATAKAEIKAVFDGINGGGPVSFRYEFSDVIDQMLISFPYYEPDINATNKDAYKCNFDCSLPNPNIDFDTPLEFCSGLSVELKTIPGDYTYQWFKDGVAIASADAINYFATESGVYSVQITDPSGCQLSSKCPVVVKVNNCNTCALTASATAQNVSCSGYANGEINVTATGISGPYTYTIIDSISQSSSTFNTLTEGNYFIEVSQNSDPTCKALTYAAVNADVEIFNTISLTSTPDAIECDQAYLEATVVSLPPSECDAFLDRERISATWGRWPKSDLRLSLLVDGVEVFSTYSWWTNPSDNTELVDPDKREAIQLKHGSMISMEVTNITSSAKSSGSDTWAYSVLDADANMVLQTTINGQMFPVGKTEVMAPVEFSCATEDPIYNYQWSPTSVLSNQTDLTATATVSTTTLVSVIATDPNDPTCPLKDSVYVEYTCNGPCTSATQAKVDITSGTSFCPGSGLELSVTTDQPSYDIQWKLDGLDVVNANSLTFIPVSAGTYWVEITDPNDVTCIYESGAIEQLVVVDTTPQLQLNDISTCGNADLTLSSVTAGSQYIDNANITYWDGPSATGSQVVDPSNVVAGTYYLRAENNNCTDEASIDVQINGSSAIVTDLSSAGPYCEGTDVDLVIAVNSGATVQWFKDNVSLTGEVNETLTLTGVTIADNGTYRADVTGTCGTESTAEVVIDVIESISITQQSSDITICEGASLPLYCVVGNGLVQGLTYNWMKDGLTIPEVNDTIILDPVAPTDGGTYGGTVTNQCQTLNISAFTVTVSSNEIPQVGLTVDNPTICEGGDLEFTANVVAGGGLSPIYTFYNADDDSELQASSASNTYTVSNATAEAINVYVQMTSNSTCVDPVNNPATSSNVSVGIDESPSQANIQTSTKTICSEGEVIQSDVPVTGTHSWSLNQLTGSGGVFSNESIGQTDLSLDDNSSVQVIYTVSNGVCPNSADTIVITRSGSLSTAYISVIDVDNSSNLSAPYNLCNGVNYEVEGSNVIANESFTWLVNGSHVSLDNDANQRTALVYNSNGSIDLSYIVTNTLDPSCADTLTIALSTMQASSAQGQSLGSDLSICEGETVQASLNSLTSGVADSYEWTLPDGSILTNSNTSLSSDTISVSGTIVITPINSCGRGPSSELMNVTVSPSTTPVMSLISNSSVSLCQGDDLVVELGVSGAGVNYSVTPSISGVENIGVNRTFTFAGVNSNSNVSFTLTPEAGGCYDYDGSEVLTQQVDVTIVSQPTIVLTSDKNSVCEGENVTVTATTSLEPSDLTWEVDGVSFSNNSLSLSLAGQNDLEVIVSYIGGSCGNGVISDQRNIVVTELEDITLNYEDGDEVCLDGNPLSAGELVYWAINGNTISSNSILLAELNSGANQIVVTNPNVTCSDTVELSLLLEVPNVSLSVNPSEIEYGESVTLIASEGYSNYAWFYEGASIGSTGENNHVDSPEKSGDYYVLVENGSGCTAQSEPQSVSVLLPITIPNAFTVNSDGENDVWLIEGLEDYERASVIVYNQWGGEVFKSNGQYVPWDGTSSKGNTLPQATYYYVIQLNDGTDRKFSGDVTIIR